MVDAIEKHGASHFAQRTRRKPDKEPAPRSPSYEQWGWYETRDGEKLYYFTSAGFKKVFQGMDPKLAARTLAAQNMLIMPNDKGRFQRKIDVGGQKHNVYAVKASVTELVND